MRLGAALFLVRGALIAVALVMAALVACGAESEMADTVEMPDTLEVRRALGDPMARDSMLDTLPGGEMVRGDSAAEMHLLRDKMP
jgi:hypothetical protein